jgi:hypothetical protein
MVQQAFWFRAGYPFAGFPTGGASRRRPQRRARCRKVAGQMAVYWSGTEFASNPNNAWNFNPDNGNQNNNDKDNQNYGWAVRPGE